MSLPTPSELLTLKFGFNGTPYVSLQLSTADTKTLAYGWQGKPLVVATSSPGSTARPMIFVAM